MRTVKVLLVSIFAICAMLGCGNASSDKQGWLGGSSEERWTMTAQQFRGLDVGMVEIGYRYQELYWAGVDSNWAYADYQQAKIELALENALVRRPNRRPSSEKYFVAALSDMAATVDGQDAENFEQAFAEFTVACNACHAAEGVPSFVVQTPAIRTSPIGMLR